MHTRNNQSEITEVIDMVLLQINALIITRVCSVIILVRQSTRETLQKEVTNVIKSQKSL